MKNFLSSVADFVREEDGASAVEYGVLVALIAVAVIVTVQLIGTQLNAAFARVSACLAAPSAANCAAPAAAN